MEKKYYNAPEIKFHQLKTKTSMLAGSSDGQGKSGEGDFDEELSKSCTPFFDEDEE